MINEKPALTDESPQTATTHNLPFPGGRKVLDDDENFVKQRQCNSELSNPKDKDNAGSNNDNAIAKNVSNLKESESESEHTKDDNAIVEDSRSIGDVSKSVGASVVHRNDSLESTTSLRSSDSAKSAGVSPKESSNPSPKKHTHKKRAFCRRNRTGCLTCRRRRIKCDEARPFCHNCIKSKKICSGYAHVEAMIRKKMLKEQARHGGSKLSIVPGIPYGLTQPAPQPMYARAPPPPPAHEEYGPQLCHSASFPPPTPQWAPRAGSFSGPSSANGPAGSPTGYMGMLPVSPIGYGAQPSSVVPPPPPEYIPVRRMSQPVISLPYQQPQTMQPLFTYGRFPVPCFSPTFQNQQQQQQMAPPSSRMQDVSPLPPVQQLNEEQHADYVNRVLEWQRQQEQLHEQHMQQAREQAQHIQQVQQQQQQAQQQQRLSQGPLIPPPPSAPLVRNQQQQQEQLLQIQRQSEQPTQRQTTSSQLKQTPAGYA